MKKPLLGLALVTGLLAAYTMWMFGRSLERKYNPGPLVKVVVAKEVLTAQTVLKREHLEIKRVPRNYMHPSTVLAQELTDILKRSLLHAMEVNQPILWSDLLGNSDEKPRLGDFLNDSERALTIKVDAVSSAGGNLSPNDHVDVLATMTHPKSSEVVTVSLLQNVTVLAVGQKLGDYGQSSDSQSHFSTATLLLHTAEEAQLLTFARHKGSLSLVVRDPQDLRSSQPAPVGYTGIFGQERKIIQKQRDQRIEVLGAR